MGTFRKLWSVLRGTADRDAFDEYRKRLLAWAREAHGLTDAEYREHFATKYVDSADRNLFLDYLLSASKDSPSYVTEHEGLLADRRRLFDRFGHPILTMRELVDEENKRLKRMDSPLRL